METRKKYKIMLSEKYVRKSENGKEWFQFPLNISGQLVAIQTIIPLDPYTEPDLEQVRKEAYQKGYEQGYKDGYNEPGKGKIQVGDEVRNIHHGWTAVVSAIDRECMTLMDTNGELGDGYDVNRFTKTGRHFPEIAEVLQKMKES